MSEGDEAAKQMRKLLREMAKLTQRVGDMQEIACSHAHKEVEWDAQLKSLRSEVESLKCAMTTLQDEKGKLETEAHNLRTEVDMLKSSAATVSVPVVPVQADTTIKAVEAVKTDTASTAAASTAAASTAAASTAVSTPVVGGPPDAPAIMPSKEKVVEAVQDFEPKVKALFITLADCVRQVMNRPLAPLPPPPPPQPRKTPAKSPVTETATAASGSGSMSWLRKALPNGMVGLNSPCSGDDGAIKDTGKKDEIKSQPENQSPGMGVSGVSKDALAEKMEAQKKKREKEIKRLGLSNGAKSQDVVEAQRCEEWCKQARIPFMKTKAELRQFFNLDPDVNDYRIQAQVQEWEKMTEEERAKRQHQDNVIQTSAVRNEETEEYQVEQAEKGERADPGSWD